MVVETCLDVCYYFRVFIDWCWNDVWFSFGMLLYVFERGFGRALDVFWVGARWVLDKCWTGFGRLCA